MKKLFLNLLTIICLIVIAISGFKIYTTLRDYKKADNVYSQLKETKEDSKPTQTATPTNTEKYVRNDEMINKIRSVMQNNESDFMKQYGYNIVVDSSIKAQTNQFTYTESRVINYLKYKFGTIRIYAEDYYKNGNLIMTMCYIL